MALRDTNFLVQLGTPLGTTKTWMKITWSLALWPWKIPGRLRLRLANFTAKYCDLSTPPRSGSMPNLAKCWLEIVTWKQEMRHLGKPGNPTEELHGPGDGFGANSPMRHTLTWWTPLIDADKQRSKTQISTIHKLIPFINKRMPRDTKGQGPLMWC